jgi:hypothetical protein
MQVHHFRSIRDQLFTEFQSILEVRNVSFCISVIDDDLIPSCPAIKSAHLFKEMDKARSY